MSTNDDEHTISHAASLLNRHIGARIRGRRLACGIGESFLSDVLSISEHELQSWEDGRVRPPGLNLLEVANLLSVHVGYFFDGLPNSGEQTSANPSTPPFYR